MSAYRFSLYIMMSAILVAVVSFTETAVAQKADTVLVRGQFYTVDEDNSWAEAVAVKDGTITYVGAMNGIRQHIGKGTKIIDLKGKFAMPSFVESHLHPLSTAYSYLFQAALFDAYTHEEYIEIITAFADDNPELEGIMGAGFDRALYDEVGPRKEWLDEIDSERPIGIISNDIHSMWVNSKVFELLGWDKDTPDPPGGRINRDPVTGEPSGLLVEMAAMSPAWELFPYPTKEEYKESLLWMQDKLNREGITTAHDAWMEFDPNYFKAFDELAKEDKLTVRYRGSWYIDPAGNFQTRWMKIKAGLLLSRNFNHPHFKVHSFKFLADNILEEETALLIEPYEHRPDYYGIKNWTDQALFWAFAQVDKAGHQIHVHVIGDGATEYTLDALQRAEWLNGARDSRHSLAHLQMATPDDVVRMGELGVTAHMSPYWMTVDKRFWDFYLPYLGIERATNTYPHQSLFDNGVNVTVASDLPTSQPDVMFAIYSGMERILPYEIYRQWYGLGTRYRSNWDDNLRKGDIGHLPPQSECVSLEDMLRAATINGAYANFLENEIGSLEVGKKADIVVLSENLFDIETESIPNVKIEMTYFEGKRVH